MEAGMVWGEGEKLERGQDALAELLFRNLDSVAGIRIPKT